MRVQLDSLAQLIAPQQTGRHVDFETHTAYVYNQVGFADGRYPSDEAGDHGLGLVFKPALPAGSAGVRSEDGRPQRQSRRPRRLE